MDMIKDWVSSLFIIILATTFIEMLIPETSMGKYVKFVFFTDNHGDDNVSCNTSCR